MVCLELCLKWRGLPTVSCFFNFFNFVSCRSGAVRADSAAAGHHQPAGYHSGLNQLLTLTSMLDFWSRILVKTIEKTFLLWCVSQAQQMTMQAIAIQQQMLSSFPPATPAPQSPPSPHHIQTQQRSYTPSPVSTHTHTSLTCTVLWQCKSSSSHFCVFLRSTKVYPLLLYCLLLYRPGKVTVLQTSLAPGKWVWQFVLSLVIILHRIIFNTMSLLFLNM